MTDLPRDEKTERKKGLAIHFATEIHSDRADVPMIACCFVSGLIDSAAYNAWTCFVSMQTGNTVFLGLGASNQPASRPFGWLRSLISIVTFVIGCRFFAILYRWLNARKRSTLVISFLIQSICLYIGAVLVETGVSPGIVKESQVGHDDDPHFITLLPLSFLAFQSGGQIVTSRNLGLNEIPTTVLTSVYCDIFSDFNILAPINGNLKRNRRVLSVIGFLVGAICGGWVSKSDGGMAAVLWFAGSVKTLITIGWATWRIPSSLG